MPLSIDTKIARIKDPVRRLLAFALERHSIHTKRQAGAKPPYTKDPVLAAYRFTNVYRELDAVTQWLSANWRTPYAKHEDLWFAMCVARLLNQPDTMMDLGWPVPFDRRHFLTKLRDRERRGRRIFNAAYIVSTNGISTNKVVYLADHVLQPLWDARVRLRPRPGDTLCSYHMLLGQMQGFGSFMAAQVVADLKYVQPLKAASDWHTFAASGPGSRRGLNYVLGRERKSPWTEENWRMELGRLKARMDPLFETHGMPPVHAQDLQNVLCEWSKYWKAVTTGAMPKRLYREQV